MHFQLLAEKSLISIKKLYNHKPFINNEISKAIMTKSRLRNRFLKKNRSETNRKLFYKQRNKYDSPLRKSKKNYFENLNEKNMTGNKSF